PVPSTSGTALLGALQYDLCPGGPDPNSNPPSCMVELDVKKAKLSVETLNPHNVKVSGPLPIRIKNLPINIVYILIPDSATVRLSNNGCTDPAGFADIDLNVEISVEVDTNVTHARQGYSRLRMNPIAVDEGQLSTAISFCGGTFSDTVATALKDI